MGIAEKRIEELKGMKFNVPSYQRGYRWTKHEVTTLLEDLYNHDSKLKYCLQPLIVKKVSENTYDVVDGQQRLTTIFIFLKFMSAEFGSSRRRSNQYEFFELAYETREKSSRYLKELSFDTYNLLQNTILMLVILAMLFLQLMIGLIKMILIRIMLYMIYTRY